MLLNNKQLAAGKLRSLSKVFSLLVTMLILFAKISFAQPLSDTEYYRAPFSAVTPTIDGIANEEIWQDATWVPIANLYLGVAPSAADFTGRYKIVWTSSRLYILTEVTDNLLSDDHPDPLTNWWDDDCVEVFLDENKSGGDHQYNYNAFAYHVAAIDYHVVDYGTDQNPHLYDDHITTKWTKNGNVYTWEMELKVFPDTYVYGGTTQPVTLTLGKKSGFNIAYCDNDETTSRESFIGSRYLQPADRDRGYIDASIFATVELVNSTAKRISTFGFTSPAATGVINGNNITVSVPAGTNVTNLVATFTNSLSSSIKIGTMPQVSGTTTNNFTNPVTYTVTAQDGTTANYTVTVTAQSIATNIAQGKPATASSSETVSTGPANAVDGVSTTRWSSLFSDPQWIYVDLGGNYSINRVNLAWEGAYGKDYKIQVSPDAAVWTDIKTATGNTSLNNDWTTLSGTGRYVRMYGTARGTSYGYSLFEMQVYGTLINGNVTPVASITSPANNSNYTSPATINLVANATDTDGTISKVEFFYNGSTLIGQSASTTNPYSFIWNNVAAGTYSITCKATDNLGAAKVSDPVIIVVNSPTTGNIAQGKTALASSSETSATGPANAVDGLTSTRWSSLFSDPQWIYVDLGNTYSVNRVNLIWEGAYGKDYKIQISADAATWTDIKTVTGNTTLNNDWTGLSGTGRYVRIYGSARGTVYGYSLFEMQVYGTLVSGNLPPNVSITSPANNSTYISPAAVNLTANATDTDGTISKVEFFYNGSTLIGQSASIANPYTFTWSNVAAGNYSITCKATDNLGATKISDPVVIAVNSPTTGNIAKGKATVASSSETSATGPINAVDGVATTRWSSLFADPQWIYVDLGGSYNVNRVNLVWEAAYGKDYKIQISGDASTWTDIKTITGNTALTNDWTSLAGIGRYVRVFGTARGTAYGYSLYEFEVYGTAAARFASDEIQIPNELKEKLHFYPNPTSETLTIEHSHVGRFIQVKIFSMQGALLKTVQVKSGDELNVADFPNGNYVLMLAEGKNVMTKIFIKK